MAEPISDPIRLVCLVLLLVILSLAVTALIGISEAPCSSVTFTEPLGS